MSSPSRRVRVDLAYDGTDFHGWQLQPRARTVQGVMEKALSRLEGGALVRVRGAGRTDAGAHARGQVADADVAVRLDDDGLTHALRSLLPADVGILRVRTADPAFHARRHAAWKTYSYTIDTTAHGNPFAARTSVHHPDPIDRLAVEEALRKLVGKRDWSGFAGSACEVNDRVRVLTEAAYREVPPSCALFVFTADGFLTHMIRNLMGTLIEISRGRFLPSRIDEILASRDRRLSGPTAPARGLCLERVVYPGESAGRWEGLV